jgi:hypothetical protein
MALALTALCAAPAPARAELAPGEATQIAEEAFVYGLPLIMNYTVFYEYFLDPAAKEYKAPANQLFNTARVYTPKDTAVVTPNSDTPYSFVGLDLRAEPMVLCNPEIEKARYFSLQLIDMYTHNYGYAGTRTTGNAAACHLVAGPAWKGEKPAGIGRVFRSETDFSIALIRTQLVGASDLENVKRIQAGYRALPLSKFQDEPAPPAAPAIAWPKIDKASADADPFAYLAFVLAFCPPTGPAAVELPLRARLAKIGIEAGKPFPPAPLAPAQKAELEAGVKSGLGKIQQQIGGLGTEKNGWRVALNAFGDRSTYAGDWTRRAAAALAGIYGNDAAEALYPMLVADADGKKPDTSTGRYTLTFPAGQLPPARAFWSVTLYDGKTQLLVDNPLNRYLINSPMLPGLAKKADGSITPYLQKDSPGAGKESNWLPAPDGPIYVVMRSYWPEEVALSGKWAPPG